MTCASFGSAWGTTHKTRGCFCKGTKKGDREIGAEIPVDVNIFGRMTGVMMPIAFLELL